jgi:hypothetical protein
MSIFHIKADGKKYDLESHGLDLAAWEMARALNGEVKELEVTNECGCTMAYHGCRLGEDGFLYFQRRERKDRR